MDKFKKNNLENYYLPFEFKNQKEKTQNSILILENGEFFLGNGFGSERMGVGELCFNTSITGYQEIITDPSYSDQIINFTFPHIGNVGTNIEDYESKLLIWGIVDVYQTKEEIENIIFQIIDKWDLSDLKDYELDISNVFNELLNRNLVFEINENEKVYFRSRMSETIRLLYHLRQMFPEHDVRDGWQNAPTLVSDYRFIRRPRFYPQRNLSSSQVMTNLQNILQQDVLRDAIEVFINSIPNFKLAKFQIESTKSIIKSLQSK